MKYYLMSGIEFTPSGRSRTSSSMAIKDNSDEKAKSIKSIPTDNPMESFEMLMRTISKNQYLESSLFKNNKFEELTKILFIYQSAFQHIQQWEKNVGKLSHLKQKRAELREELEKINQNTSRLRSDLIREREIEETFRERWGRKEENKKQGYQEAYQSPYLKKNNYVGSPSSPDQSYTNRMRRSQRSNSQYLQNKTSENKIFESPVPQKAGKKISENSLHNITDQVLMSKMSQSGRCAPLLQNAIDKKIQEVNQFQAHRELKSQKISSCEYSFDGTSTNPLKKYNSYQPQKNQFFGFDTRSLEIPPEEDFYPELSWLNKDLTQLSQSFSKCNIFGTKFDDSDSEDEEIDYYKTFMRDFIKVSSVYSSHLMQKEQKTE